MRRRHDPKKGFPNHGHACVMGLAFRSCRRLSPAPHPRPMPLVTIVMAPSLSRGTSMAWCRMQAKQTHGSVLKANTGRQRPPAASTRRRCYAWDVKKRCVDFAVVRGARHGRFVWGGSPSDRDMPPTPFPNFGPMYTLRHGGFIWDGSRYENDRPAGGISAPPDMTQNASYGQNGNYRTVFSSPPPAPNSVCFLTGS